jgi:hypothetical protein
MGSMCHLVMATGIHWYLSRPDYERSGYSKYKYQSRLIESTHRFDLTWNVRFFWFSAIFLVALVGIWAGGHLQTTSVAAVHPDMRLLFWLASFGADWLFWWNLKSNHTLSKHSVNT